MFLKLVDSIQIYKFEYLKVNNLIILKILEKILTFLD